MEQAMSNRRVGSLEGKIEKVKLSVIDVDFAYQRGIKPHSRKIEKNFIPAAAGVLTIGRRSSGKMYVIDGLQRLTAMMRLGIEHWKCLVLESSGAEYEAQIFKMLNGGRVAVTSSQMFLTSLTAKDPVALAAVEAAKAAGVKVSLPAVNMTGTKPLKYGEIACLGALYKVTASFGEGVVTRTLNLIMKTWPGQDEAMAEPFFQGVARLVAWQGEVLGDERFITQLNIPPRQIMLDAGNYLGQKNKGMIETLCKYYNKGLRKESGNCIRSLEQLKIFNEQKESRLASTA
jgi:hypothetical protein